MSERYTNTNHSSPGYSPRYHNFLQKKEDPTDQLLSLFGTGLLIAFFMPVVIIGAGLWKIFFINIEWLLDSHSGVMVKFQMLYPLVAGIILKVLVNSHRSVGRSAVILLTGLLPFFLLLINKEVQGVFHLISQYIPGSGAIIFHAVLAILGSILFLGGAHALRIQPGHDIAAKVAAAGGALYCFSHLLSIKSGFSLFAPFRTMGQEDTSGLGLNLVNGIAELITLGLLIAAAVLSIMLYNRQESSQRELKANSIIGLWALHLFVYGAVIVYIIIATVLKSFSMGGTFLLVATTFLIKMVPWILGLFIMIPLGAGEILLSFDPPGVKRGSELI